VITFIHNIYRHAASIAPVLVEKCLGSARPKTKDKAVQALLNLVEADSPEPVVENLLKGCANKVPKISATSISTLREALRYVS
jgi:cytoskeleton-associated protein 5